MASVQDRLKLKRESCDTWSTREQLCLASSVLKSGDQNWISVSRSLRPFAEKEALRPPDWFSQKSCAIQYAILLENADTPKRKKRESGETTGESIVRRLTQERITELGQILAFQRDEYQQLKNEVNLLKSGNISDEKLKKMWEAIEQEEREAEQKARAHSAWLAKRQQKNDSPASQIALPTPRKSVEPPPETQELQELLPESEEDKKSRGGRSPLLTSLLKSPSPTTQIQNPPSTAQTTSPTIASLLGASPKAPSPQKSTTAPPQFHHVVTSLLTPSVPERPSAGAPTLSMLLELPSNLSRNSLTNLPTPLNSSPLKESRDLKPKSTNRVSSPITNPIASIQGNESMVQIIDHIDDVIGKDKMPEVIDKDEINEIIGDIEELIKEEITKSPKGSDAGGIVEVIGPGGEGKGAGIGEVDEGVSSSSTQEDMAIDEIDQSTSSIAEIIGTAVEPELKGVDEGIREEGGEVEDEGDEDETEGEEREGEEEKEDEEDKSMSVGEKDENVELKEEDDDQQEKEEEREEEEGKEEEEEEGKNDMEEDAEEEKTVPEEIPDVPKPEIQSPEPEISVSDCKNEKEEAELPKEEVEATIENEEKEEEEKVESVLNKEEDEAEEKTIEIIVPEETTEFKVVLEVKSEESPVFEEEKPEVKDESVHENDEKTENSDSVEDSAELSPKPEDKDSEDEKPEIDDEIFHEANDKFEENEETPTKTEESSELPIMKEEEPSAEPEDTKTDQVPEIPDDELKEEAKTPENSDEIMEELEEEPKKFEDNSSKDDIEEELDPPVLPNELEDPQIVEKKEDDEEMKPEVQVKESEEESEAKSEPVDHVTNEEELLDEKTEIEPIPEATELPKQEKEEKEVKNEDIEMKKEETTVSTQEDPEIEEEESSLTKLPARAMKTYSKKQNAVVDSEPETESDADYKAWRKSILLHYSRLATHKYASLFLRPITEDHAPGYHSVVFRPMDLSTIKKNIDNGTIRTNMQFQRDVMLMFQNAIMYNKSDSFVYKMAVSMQEECLQSMQILVEATGEGAYRRDTRTAASSSSETSESSIIKRKRSHITPSPMILDNESPRMKKRRRSEND